MASIDQNLVNLPNPHLSSNNDYLYHFHLKTDEDLSRRFNDIKVGFDLNIIENNSNLFTVNIYPAF